MRSLLCLIFFLCASSVNAFLGECVLDVDGRTYLNSVCNIEMIGTDGSFSIGIGEQTRSKYFAVVSVDPDTGVAAGYWNGIEAESHAHTELGNLVKQGDCWVNDRASVCAKGK
jgi:hypothetical protein